MGPEARDSIALAVGRTVTRGEWGRPVPIPGLGTLLVGIALTDGALIAAEAWRALARRRAHPPGPAP